jgi:hypothetical protein
MTESPIPGYKHDPWPDRYPTRETWPRPGARGHYKGKPVQLMEIYFQYYALFKTGPYSTMTANLQDFVVWPFPDAAGPVPWTPSEIRASLPDAPL